MTESRIDEVRKVLDKVRPALQADGGDVELVELTEDGIVRVRLQGRCGGCPMATMTLKHGIERRLVDELDYVKSVEQVF
ncbi:MAG: hypothetical protein CVV64_08935 [Candidatus Wallbacteria bacterium HGW-Wallbacteria-1]|jgi:Fe-S cluster biogenesis protein NfuA|uniref:NIF system FeS cluster assembly NifU C-terminal domain-containing protein n=1 Tax=Candidatus Wallbacteria bacterium HGW-Wallbacteria-1 TaxID=2013854 RepID=A0A2N1PQ64_9BACT|nr:MAG: hypothetical protein CVV64_08935 [Candidatus Wallbacteria bacterium HGW-Wallbacteria-1]